MIGPARRLRVQAAVGAAVAVAMIALGPLPPFADGGSIRIALLVAVLVVVPLGVALAVVPDRRGPRHEPWTLRALAVLQLPAALLASAGLLLPQGAVAGALCVPWLLVAILGILWAAQRFLQRPWPLAEEVAFDAALAFLVNGATFLLLWRAGLLLGFADVVVALTAVHFHFASFAIPVMLGAAGRALRTHRDRGFALAVAAVVVGMPVTAAGILASRALESVGAVLVAAAGVAAAILAVRAGWRIKGLPGLMLATAAAAALGGMGLAAAYGLRFAELGWTPPFDAMLVVHSVLNGAGFAGLGILGWTLAHVPPRSAPAGLPFSRLRSDGPVGPAFFERSGAVDAGRPAPRGLMADLGMFAGPGFDAARVHPAVRAFYEETLSFQLSARDEWPPGSGIAHRVWRRLGRRFGQMDFPDSGSEGTLASRLLPLRADVDGRTDVRGWVRTRPDGRALYAAAYSTHESRGERYANIAFPLPAGSLTSVLRWEDLPGRPGGLRLTTHPGDRPGDQGVYFANRWMPVRLPINETIAVWMDAEGPKARHDMRVLGMRFLTLHYRMDREQAAANGKADTANMIL